MIQSGITNFVSMLDNVMVGRVGTLQMSGVAIANEWVFIFSLCTFGCLSGAGIFGAQFYGKRDMEGMRDTFRFKLISGAVLGIIGILFLKFFGDWFIALYMTGDNSAEDMALTATYARQYMDIIIWQLVPFVIVQLYASTLKETSETVKPMTASLIAVLVNLTGNYLLIYGKCGLPCLGVRGAAIATVAARFVEMGYIVIWTHSHKEKNEWIIGAYKSLRVPKELAKKIIIKGTPLLLNEGLWSAGITVLNQSYAYRGLQVVAAMNICFTEVDVLNVVYLSLGSAVAILAGQLLGAGKLAEAKDFANKVLAFAIFIGAVVGVFMAALAGVFPRIYNTEEEVRHLATLFIIVFACSAPVSAYLNSSYFIIRSGGRTLITFLFDCVFIWTVSVPIARVLGHHTDMAILGILICVQAADLIKCATGHFMIKKEIWIRNIVS